MEAPPVSQIALDAAPCLRPSASERERVGLAKSAPSLFHLLSRLESEEKKWLHSERQKSWSLAVRPTFGRAHK